MQAMLSANGWLNWMSSACLIVDAHFPTYQADEDVAGSRLVLNDPFSQSATNSHQKN
uniref:Uncharacterized protein n=1 Tax=Anguilla anguilla TaxID=7936 RepID=A0A0E9SCI6_ANGAN